MHGPRKDPELVASITSAAPPLSEDQSRRTRVYLIQMAIRIVCFLGAVLAHGTWLMWVLAAAAVVLPYTAVVFANAGRDQAHYDSSPMEPAALPPARDERGPDD